MKRHTVSTRAMSMNPEPWTVTTVPPDDGPEDTLRPVTVALWYVNATRLVLKLSEFRDTSTTSSHAPGPHRGRGVVQVIRSPLSAVASTTSSRPSASLMKRQR